MPIAAKQTEYHVQNMRTRMPFKFGIATMTHVAHLYVKMTFDIDGKSQWGVASEGLLPKWFRKDADQPFRDEVAEMFRVIKSACCFAEQVGPQATPFDLWQAVLAEQRRWASDKGYPPLLWSFGVTLPERAAIDAWCRANGTTFARAVRDGSLGVRLGELHHELAEASTADLLPDAPSDFISVRHTVGLVDPLTDADVPADEKVADGLPHTLEQVLAAYKVRYLKIKLGGDVSRDADRLHRIAKLLEAKGINDYRFTLDGNEQYKQVAPFRELWEGLRADASLAPFLSKLIVVEQPLYRDVALSRESSDALLAWDGRPPMIIDESDATLDSAEDALKSGYVGTSHKNCKGVFKGVGNACMIEHRRRADPEGAYTITAEDLVNVGPVALLEDLAVLATLGITHAERNGHHYLKGLSMMPEAVQQQVLDRHGDLYHRHEGGYAALNVVDGRIDVRSVTAAPFGLGIELDTSQFTPLDDWTYESLGAE